MKGKANFERVGCYQCHGHQGQGGREGPRIADPVPLAWPALQAWVRTTSGDLAEDFLALRGIALRRFHGERRTRNQNRSGGQGEKQFHGYLLARLGDDVDEDRLAPLHGFDAALHRGSQILRIGDRADADLAQGTSASFSYCTYGSQIVVPICAVVTSR